MSEAVHPVPEGFNARIGPPSLRRCTTSGGRSRRFWLDQAKRLDLEPLPDQGRRLVVRRG
jgi:hypothetical protein